VNRTPIERLMAEHRTIAKVLAATASLVDQLELDQPLELVVFKDLIDFFQIYADQSHHGKEEEVLFPLLKKRAYPIKDSPFEVLVKEHERSRDLMAALAEAADDFEMGDPTAREDLITCLRGILHLYPGHMWKEDYLLFPTSEKILSAEDLSLLAQDFAKIDGLIGPVKLQDLEDIADSLINNHESSLSI
jgi:hemerythrin-like domain-containing protein